MNRPTQDFEPRPMHTLRGQLAMCSRVNGVVRVATISYRREECRPFLLVMEEAGRVDRTAWFYSQLDAIAHRRAFLEGNV